MLDINEMLKKMTKVGKQHFLYAYLEPMGSFKDRLWLVARDEDLVQMCSWVPRFKVIEFYAEKRDVESIIESQPYMKRPVVKSSMMIEKIEEP